MTSPKSWKNDIQGIGFSFLKHSVPTYWNAHTVLNDIYNGEAEGDPFRNPLTSDSMDTVKPDCASLLLDAIFDIIQSMADDQGQPDRLKSIIDK